MYLIKAKLDDLYIGCKCWQYNGDPLPLIVKYIDSENIILTYCIDGHTSVVFPIKYLGKEFYTLYIIDKHIYLFES